MEYFKLAFENFKKEISKISNKNILVALCGGNSVGRFYEEIGKRFLELPFGKMQFFMLDERYPENQRNSILVREKLMKNIPQEIFKKVFKNFHFLGKGNLDEIVRDYESELKKYSENLKFDIIIASSGPDSHIASIFPESSVFDSENFGYAVILDSPKPPKQRITLLPKSIVNSGVGFLFFIGNKKQFALENFFNEKNEKKYPTLLFKKIKHYVVSDIENG